MNSGDKPADDQARLRCTPHLLARACHEIRNGLSAIKLNLSLIESQCGMDKRTAAMNQSLRELELIDDAVHTLVRLDLGRLEPDLQPVALADIVPPEADLAYAPGIRNTLQEQGAAEQALRVRTDIRLARLAVATVLRQLHGLSPDEVIHAEVAAGSGSIELRLILANTDIGDGEQQGLLSGGDLHGGLGLEVAVQLLRDVNGTLEVAPAKPTGTAVTVTLPAA